MTTEIPKQPDPPDIGQRDADYLWENFFCAEAKHEHAVARVAVEALKATERLYGCCAECGWTDDDAEAEGKAHSDYCKIGMTLAKIKASGWKP